MLFFPPAGLDDLSAAVDAAEAMQTRARDSIRMRQPMAELQRILEDAASMPAYVPEVEAVAGLLTKAQDWLRKAGNAASQVCFMKYLYPGPLTGTFQCLCCMLKPYIYLIA